MDKVRSTEVVVGGIVAAVFKFPVLVLASATRLPKTDCLMAAFLVSLCLGVFVFKPRNLPRGGGIQEKIRTDDCCNGHAHRGNQHHEVDLAKAFHHT